MCPLCAACSPDRPDVSLPPRATLRVAFWGHTFVSGLLTPKYLTSLAQQPWAPPGCSWLSTGAHFQNLSHVAVGASRAVMDRTRAPQNPYVALSTCNWVALPLSPAWISSPQPPAPPGSQTPSLSPAWISDAQPSALSGSQTLGLGPAWTQTLSLSPA